MIVKLVVKRKNENMQIWSRYSLFQNTDCRLPASSSAALNFVITLGHGEAYAHHHCLKLWLSKPSSEHLKYCLYNWEIRINFMEIWTHVQKLPLKKIHLKLSSAKWWPSSHFVPSSIHQISLAKEATGVFLYDITTSILSWGFKYMCCW